MSENALQIVPEAAGSRALAVRASMLPSVEAMRQKLDEHEEVRALLIDHIKKGMIEGIHGHYGDIPGTKSKMLLQPGARYLHAMFSVTPGRPEKEEVHGDDGHYRCTVTVPLLSEGTGEVVRWGSSLGPTYRPN